MVPGAQRNRHWNSGSTDVVEQQCEQGRVLAVGEAHDARRPVAVDVEALAAGLGVHAHDRMLVRRPLARCMLLERLGVAWPFAMAFWSMRVMSCTA